MGWIIIPVFFLDMSMWASSSSRASTVMAVAGSPRLLHLPLHPPNRHFPHSNSDPFTFKTSSKDSILRTQISTSPSTAAVRGSARWACCCLAGSEPLSSSSSRRLPKWVGGVWRQCAKFAVPCALAVALSLSGMNVAVLPSVVYIYIYMIGEWIHRYVGGLHELLCRSFLYCWCVFVEECLILAPSSHLFVCIVMVELVPLIKTGAIMLQWFAKVLYTINFRKWNGQKNDNEILMFVLGCGRRNILLFFFPFRLCF